MPKKSAAVIGGGITGISAALELAISGQFKVTIIEKESKLGGLSTSFQWQDLICDRYYHVILPNDMYTISFIKDVGLGTEIFWQDTKTAFFGHNKLMSLSSIRDFLRFPFLSLWQKLRLGLGVIYSAHIRHPGKLDKVYAHQWLKKVFGKKVYEIIWEPLLRSKLGEAQERTSAAFIWAPISRLYGARSSGNKQEKMGYIRGGYQAVLSAAQGKMDALNVNVKTNMAVERIEFKREKAKITVITDSDKLEFDKVLFTLPSPEILRILGNVDDHPYWKQLSRMEYLGIMCVLLVLDKKLSPYYVINLLDKELPFTGIIETTNVISPHDIGDRHLVYLPKYITHDDPMNEHSDGQIMQLFVDKLKKVFPVLKNEGVLHRTVFRERDFQPIQELNFLDSIVDIKTPIENVYLVNTSMICDSTINNNAAIKLAHEAAKIIIEDSSTW